MKLRRSHVYRLFPETKKKIINISALALVTALGIGVVLPAMTTHQAIGATPPTIPTWKVGGVDKSCGSTTQTNLVTPSWTVVENAVAYEYSYKSPGSADWVYDSTRYTATSIPDQAFGAPGVNNGTEGTWQFKIRAVMADASEQPWSEPCAIIYQHDHSAPTATITAPTATTVRGTVAIAGAADEPLQRYYFVIIDKNGKVVAGPATVNQPSVKNFSWDTTKVTDGSYTIRLDVRDLAGNKDDKKSIATKSVTVDNTAPATPTATLTADSDGSAVLSDGFTNSQYFTFDLSSSGDTKHYSLRYWNDIVGSPFKQSSPWSTGFEADSAGKYTYKDNFTQGDGVHYFSFTACDTAGNCSEPLVYRVTLDRSVPKVAMENFNTNADDNYNGISVGFSLDGFRAVSSVKVELLDAAGKTIVANTDTPKLLTLISDGAEQLSTYFVTDNTPASDIYWQFGAYEWSSNSAAPAAARVTVEGQNGTNQPVIVVGILNGLSQGDPSWPDFESVLPPASEKDELPVKDNPPAVLPIGDVTGTPARDVVSNTPAAGNFLQPAANRGLNRASAVLRNIGVLGASTQPADPPVDPAQSELPAKVKGTQSSNLPSNDTFVLTQDTKSKPAAASFWWLTALIVPGMVLWLILAKKRKTADETETARSRYMQK